MNISPEEMQAAAGEATDLLKALAHPHRLMIVCQLLERERSVGELAGLLRLRDSTVSRHLALLRKDGLVEPRRDGQTIWYSIASAAARALLTTLYHVYCGPAPVCTVAGRRASGRKRHPRIRSGP
jgi:DNA-binding transcriptional ArsR family regulator